MTQIISNIFNQKRKANVNKMWISFNKKIRQVKEKKKKHKNGPNVYFILFYFFLYEIGPTTYKATKKIIQSYKKKKTKLLLRTKNCC